jgi:hypothetical protein
MVKRISILLLLSAFAACGSPSATPLTNVSTGCQSGTALIQVSDGFLTRVCGCTETSGVTFRLNESLTCTVSKNSSVVFSYVGASLPHQIVAVGTPTFVSSPFYDPHRQRIKCYS